MKLYILYALGLATGTAYAIPSESSTTRGLSQRADPSLVGYLGVFFLGDAPNVYFYLSDGNDALAFNALNGGGPIPVPTLETLGVRDPSIISEGGDEAGNKWYIIGTDLDVAKV